MHSPHDLVPGAFHFEKSMVTLRGAETLHFLKSSPEKLLHEKCVRTGEKSVRTRANLVRRRAN